MADTASGRGWWRGRGLLRGVAVSLLLLLITASGLLMGVVDGYDGSCGGLFPWLAGGRPCTLWEYLAGMLPLALSAALIELWPWLLAALLAGPALGLLADRASVAGRQPGGRA